MRRERLAAVLGLAAVVAVAGGAARPAPPPVAVTVYKSPSCTCCSKWVDHMRKEGFTVTTHDVDDVAPFKRDVGVPEKLESCHTAVVGGYTIEGHVPADVVRQALKDKPKIAGLAVPGMPMGSPGMEGPRKDPYAVVAFEQNGRTSVFAKR